MTCWTGVNFLAFFRWVRRQTQSASYARSFFSPFPSRVTSASRSRHALKMSTAENVRKLFFEQRACPGLNSLRYLRKLRKFVTIVNFRKICSSCWALVISGNTWKGRGIFMLYTRIPISRAPSFSNLPITRTSCRFSWICFTDTL